MQLDARHEIAIAFANMMDLQLRFIKSFMSHTVLLNSGTLMFGFGSTFFSRVFGAVDSDDDGFMPVDSAAEFGSSFVAKGHTHQGSQRRGGVVEETPSRSHAASDSRESHQKSDDENIEKSVEPTTETTSTRTLLFKVLEMQMEETESVDYLSNVLNWKAEPFVGKRPLCPSVQFGPYTLPELIDAVKSAADASGFATYPFRGARKSKTSCSIKFGCDHGRLRYGQEKDAISKKSRDFVKDMEEVVHDQPGKRRRPRKRGGYKRSKTQRHRVKNKECPFTLCLRSCGEKWCADTPCKWTLNGDSRCCSCYEHRNHCNRPFRSRMSDEIRSHIIENGETMLISDLVSNIFKKFSVEVTCDQVKYILRKNSIKNLSSAGAQRFRAGGAVDAMKYLLATEASDIRLLLINCETGSWFTAKPDDKRCEKISLSPYDIPKNKLSHTDPTREIMIEGSKYIVWVAAWNYGGESELFSAYPHVVQMDCIHGVTSSTDGFNAVGVDGNGHNIQLLRAFIGNQDSYVFGWLFNVAFPELVPMYKSIRVFFLDGCKAMNAALRQACCIGQPFENAKIFRCIFHFIIKAFEDKFGCGDSGAWQSHVKKLMFGLRRCESHDEFTACSEFSMRVIALLPALGSSRSLLRANVLSFVQRRIDCSKLWVLMHQLKLPTRGCTSTSRVEGTHGRDRVDDRITARNSWGTTVKRNTERSKRRQRARIAWARRQLGSQLLRSPMNPDESVFTKNDLETMDAVMFPWAVESVEEQAALGMRLKVIFTKKGTSLQTNSRDTSRTKPSSGEFKVWYEDSDGSNDDGDDFSFNDADISDVSDTSESSSSGDDNDSDSSREESPTKKKSSHCDHDHQDSSSEDQDSSSEDVDDGTKTPFNVDEFFEQCDAAPLEGCTKFHWTKVRTVMVVPLYDDAQRNTGKYLLHCNCGFPTRIGVVCRHIFAVLFHMLCNLLRTDPTSDSDESETVDPKSIDWSSISNFSLSDLCNMDIVSKVKYHAALHGRGNLFKLSTNAFYPTIPCKVAQDFFRQYDPLPKLEQNIPENGLPRDEHDVDCPESDAHPKAAASNEANADTVNRREIQPTEFGVSKILTDTWNFTHRFNITGKNTARKLIRQRCLELQNEIKAMETHAVRSEDLRRHFSKRDMFNGNAQRRRDSQ